MWYWLPEHDEENKAAVDSLSVWLPLAICEELDTYLLVVLCGLDGFQRIRSAVFTSNGLMAGSTTFARYGSHNLEQLMDHMTQCLLQEHDRSKREAVYGIS